jgi:hypothetical protein
LRNQKAKACKRVKHHDEHVQQLRKAETKVLKAAAKLYKEKIAE